MPYAIKMLGKVSGATSKTVAFASGRRSEAGTSLGGIRPQVTAIVSSIVVCETGDSAATFRVSVAAYGTGTTANPDLILYDVALSAKQTKAFSLGITLSQGDFVEVYASSANINFFVFGAEMS